MAKTITFLVYRGNRKKQTPRASERSSDMDFATIHRMCFLSSSKPDGGGGGVSANPPLLPHSVASVRQLRAKKHHKQIVNLEMHV